MKNFQKMGNNPMKMKSNSGKGVQGLAQGHIRISVSKARRVIDQIRGRSYNTTLMLLLHMPYRASSPILNLVVSAGKNVQNMGLMIKDSYISKAEVNRSTIVKKLRSRARGRFYPIKRTMCHIKIVLEEDQKKLLGRKILDRSKI